MFLGGLESDLTLFELTLLVQLHFFDPVAQFANFQILVRLEVKVVLNASPDLQKVVIK